MTIPATAYDPADTEPEIYQKWQDSGAFQPQWHLDDKGSTKSQKSGEEGLARRSSKSEVRDAGKKPYVITLPPPNITGNLHMGHALQDTIMDILIRHHRMLGRPTLWLPGTDHAAIATNKIIEQQLHDEGKTRHDVGRAEFMRRTEAWYASTSAAIINQMKRLGCSADWSRQRFTMDEQYVEAVNAAFLQFYAKGYIYRGARIVNWDPKAQTTVSDLEIDYQPETTKFYYLQYGPFTIGTARPETKFGDKYLVVHPDDDRYADWKHRDTFEAEWINGPIQATIIKDEAAVPKQGSGAMTITPWHSHADFEIAQRHNLDMEQIIDFDGNLLPIAGEFAGQPITKARAAIVDKLQAKGLVVDIDDKYKHNLALNDRGKGVIEPQVMRQWFVDMSKLKDRTIAAAQDGDVTFVPPRWQQHFVTWMENVQDWNINRQIWLGHRLPVWWKKGTHGTNDEDGNFVVSIEKPEGDYEQDPDTLDTWFSSALWPFATLGWPQQTDDLDRFYPGSALVTARDILYLWVARMVFSGLEFMDEVPFEDVVIHPTVLAKDGRRMSKSLGTGIDPLDLIDQYGADATRFGLMYQMAYDSQAIKFDDSALRNARNFANKLWNIAKLLESLTDDVIPSQAEGSQSNRTKDSIADHWIQARLADVTEAVTTNIQSYKIGEAAHLLHEFVWKEFADWYLEILKTDGSPDVAREVFDHILTLLHPFMPYVTESIFSHRHPESLLITTPWPEAAVIARSEATKQSQDHVAQTIATFQDLVSTIRSARVLLGITPGETIDVYLPTDPPLPAAFTRLTLSNLVSKQQTDMKAFPTAATGLIYIGGAAISSDHLAQAVDKLKAEQERLQGLIAKQQGIISGMTGKAPQDKIDAKQAELEAWQTQLQQTNDSLQLLS